MNTWSFGTKITSNMANNTSETIGRNNLISSGTNIKGDIEAAGDIRVDGAITGTLKSSGKVVIGLQGCVDGVVICKNADISGKVKGSIMVEELTSLKSTSQLEADLCTRQLFIEVGAIFTGKCIMGQKPDKIQEEQS